MRNIKFGSVGTLFCIVIIAVLVMSVYNNTIQEMQAGDINEALNDLYESKCVADDGALLESESEYCSGVSDAWDEVDRAI